MEYYSAIIPLLSPGERILWTGCPARGIIFHGYDILAIPASIVWCSFAVAWEYIVVSDMSDDMSWFFALWGIPFVIAGLYITAGRFIDSAMLRARTVYAITNERIIIASDFLQKRVTSFPLRTLDNPTLVHLRDGRGTILFGGSPLRDVVQAPRWSGKRQIPAQFERIADAQHVYEMIRQAQRALK